jgi:hypothetical protein
MLLQAARLLDFSSQVPVSCEFIRFTHLFDQAFPYKLNVRTKAVVKMRKMYNLMHDRIYRNSGIPRNIVRVQDAHRFISMMRRIAINSSQ